MRHGSLERISRGRARKHLNAYRDAVGAHPFRKRRIIMICRSDRRQIGPMLLLDTEAYPFVLVVVVLLSIIGPYPALLFFVTIPL